MKNLKLGILNFLDKEILDRQQLRNILGGDQYYGPLIPPSNHKCCLFGYNTFDYCSPCDNTASGCPSGSTRYIC